MGGKSERERERESKARSKTAKSRERERERERDADCFKSALSQALKFMPMGCFLGGLRRGREGWGEGDRGREVR